MCVRAFYSGNYVSSMGATSSLCTPPKQTNGWRFTFFLFFFLSFFVSWLWARSLKSSVVLSASSESFLHFSDFVFHSSIHPTSPCPCRAPSSFRPCFPLLHFPSFFFFLVLEGSTATYHHLGTPFFFLRGGFFSGALSDARAVVRQRASAAVSSGSGVR
ncbi:hypothetical protein C8R45DRAFT_436344 [Mycena sanguinolenta]|nr:hypothetical protein C8R45DRAFT_436344 [Mycena sanguinolenta]